ncbi:ABC transporter substrate-binding protein [Dictyobacter formicarum]|uniref:Solute-binding protein family 3/N-terminal domain-containing protein n=1 Tax=Dictyobacter formicarum TaxID=2778368 RepID=A0ABQ3VIK3_9CHLR|nr:ABC transporter substrate-binding protein [Dictyobacter formicarum]GHO85506.1 hypothetical protein KSZ_35120 [Dictyobacter formicarum]
MVYPFLGGGRRYRCLNVFLSVCLCLFFLTACEGGSASPSLLSTPSPTVDPALYVITANELTVGSYLNYPPQEFLESTSKQPAGFDIDLISDIAAKMHLKNHVVSNDFSSLIDGLVARRFDVVISAVSITPEVQKRVNFIPYFRGGKSFLVLKGNPLAVHSLVDLCGKSVAVQEQTSEPRELLSMGEMCRQNSQPAINVVTVKQYDAALQLLQSQRVAAAYEDASVADYSLLLHPNVLQRVGGTVGVTTEGILVRNDDVALSSTIRLALESLQQNGTYHSLIQKWGLYSGDITVPANYNIQSQTATGSYWKR